MQEFHLKQGTRQINWLWGWFCLCGLTIWRKVFFFFIKKFNSNGFAFLRKPITFLLKTMMGPRGWITIRPIKIQIPTTSDATDTELPGPFLMAVVEAVEAAAVGGLVTVSTALEEVYLVKQNTSSSKFQVYMYELSHHYTVELRLTANLLMQLPRYYGCFILAQKHFSQSFSYLKNPFNATTPLIRPYFCSPLVTRLTGFHWCFLTRHRFTQWSATQGVKKNFPVNYQHTCWFQALWLGRQEVQMILACLLADNGILSQNDLFSKPDPGH